MIIQLFILTRQMCDDLLGYKILLYKKTYDIFFKKNYIYKQK